MSQSTKTTWASHLKEFAAANGMTYREAMSNEKAKKEWADNKPPPKPRAPRKPKEPKAKPNQPLQKNESKKN